MEIFYSIEIWQFVASSFVISSLLLGTFAQIYRFRYVSGPAERQQTKWVVLGISAMFAGITTWIIFIEVFPLPPGINRVLVNLVLVTIVSMFNWIFPITVTLAILRYRLWDIDIIVRRTLQYTLLTGILALVYFGSVIVLQSLTDNLFGEQTPLVIVFSTLAIAALFNPLRRRIQDFIDRRFYRKTYSTEQALTQFAATTRDEVELEKLTAALLGVVEETVQPEKVSIWMPRIGKE